MKASDFLVEKAANMRAWLRDSGYDVSAWSNPTGMQMCLFASTLSTHGETIAYRDWEELKSIEMPEELLAVAKWVEARAHLHDKFWRYLALFSEVV